MSIKSKHAQRDNLQGMWWYLDWCQWFIGMLGLEMLADFTRCKQIFNVSFDSRPKHTVANREMTFYDSLVPGMKGFKDYVAYLEEQLRLYHFWQWGYDSISSTCAVAWCYHQCHQAIHHWWYTLAQSSNNSGLHWVPSWNAYFLSGPIMEVEYANTKLDHISWYWVDKTEHLQGPFPVLLLAQ